ncbi:nucleotide sugar dehydrogenase [Amycolatopsis alkalitolerans]|uniref:Nucleotide sugar dehydrogenase n=1 Tax=Amycolatopsis alkalitolerans TaxID=2547244 RepID=A0A5C4LT59_9PSEU|nr:nucleotide sugar dehydrogenase [Amycolatopsis alkalitolerans]TNC21878.1 nucleotide sugar dehydrogenase [Amycolatopsis alkalitolerans]
MTTPPPTRLVVVGQGYVGLPLAMRAVEAGFFVVGLDLDTVRVWSLKDGSSYVDDVPADQLRRALASGRYLPTGCYDDAQAFDAAIVTVPTPLRDSIPDLHHVESAMAGLAPHLRPGATVVLESTTYPGTTEEVVVPLLEQGSGLVAGRDFSVGYSPERIDPGNRRWNLVNTPKIVSGVDAASLVAVKSLYARLVQTTVPVSTTKEAELTKLLENTFRHVNIALVNEIAVFAHELGVDVWEAIDAATTKPFGYCRFTPGPGVGGHCLPVDTGYLSWHVRRSLNRDFRFVALANDINDQMPDYVVQRLVRTLDWQRKSLRDSVILVLGMAYKPNTGDIRESPVLRVIDLLATRGAVVHVVDSHVEPHRCPASMKLVELTEAEIHQADAVVLLTDHDDIDYEFVGAEAKLVLDTRHRLSGPQVEYL